MSSIRNGILDTIGDTPLVRLQRLIPGAHFNVFAKLEGFNPGGSVKDRTALNLIHTALESNRIRPGSTVIESSSGNLGIGLSHVCLYYGLRFICVVDPKTTERNLEIMRAYSATIEMVTKPDPETGEYLSARIKRVRELLAEIPGSFCPDQYSNRANPAAHHRTLREVIEALDGKLDYLFCATSTCGTLRGAAEYLRSHGYATKVFAVDARGSVIFGQARSTRLIPGHGAAVVPPLFYPELADSCVHVSDIDCVTGCRQLLAREAILAGGSSGGIVSALMNVRQEIPAGANVVIVLCDRGERYLDTVYSEPWVRRRLLGVEA